VHQYDAAVDRRQYREADRIRAIIDQLLQRPTPMQKKNGAN
jgi:hypothetical protein